MLTRDQLDHFDTFGFVVLRAAFTYDETERLHNAAEAAYRDLLGREPRPEDVIWEPGQVEERDDLRWLIEDDRIHESVAELLGERFIWFGSELMRGVDRKGPVHHWHTDGETDPDKLPFRRLKVMIYLDRLRCDSGALRLIPGSHRSPFFDALVPFHKAHQTDEPRFFGMDGPDIPCYPVETDPGDVVFVNPWLFHSVYGNSGTRRNVVLKYSERPSSDAALRPFRGLVPGKPSTTCLIPDGAFIWLSIASASSSSASTAPWVGPCARPTPLISMPFSPRGSSATRREPSCPQGASRPGAQPCTA